MPPAGESFTVHTSNRLEVLLDALAGRMAADPLPPLVAETIVVPGQGMARWVTLELARRHGVAATLDLPFPGAFLQRLGGDGAGFDRDTMLWRIFRLLGDPGLTARLGAAAAYCRGDPDQLRRLQLAGRLTACFDDYQLYRDDLLAAWAAGDEGRDPHERWQALLWRALLRDAGAPAGTERETASPTGRRQQLLFGEEVPAPAARTADPHRLQRLRALLADPAAARAALPPRVSVFGLSALPAAFVGLLQQIAAHVPVTVYAPQASPQRGVRAAASAGHPLLAAWGRQSRELAELLLASGAALRPLECPDPGTGTLLHALQRDLRDLRARGDAAPLPVDARDDSLRVHSVHGPLREMEVLRDQLLAALAGDPTLTPADVLVLLPDVHAYAPYVHAVFRPVARLLPFHVADRSPAADLPVPALMLRVLALVHGRFTAPELLLLLEEPGLARRFGIARPDLAVLRRWVHRARIRWGLDGEQRRRDLELPGFEDNTWRQGIDRLLMGHATGLLDEPVLGVLPAAGATGDRGELLGRFAAFLEAVVAVGQALGRPHSLAAWADAVDAAVAALLLPAGDEELRGVRHLQQVCEQLRDLHERSRLREEVSPRAFAHWLEAALRARGEGRGFLSGAITFAALRPMRAVPVRVLAVCGLGDGAFPRREQRASFDLLARERRPGDRDGREDDRQLFLDALGAARDRLVLSWVGRSPKDNSECAPSPVLSELLEHLDEAFRPPAGFASVREFVAVQHPLQAFSPRYGRDDARLFTYGDAPAAPPPVPAAVPVPEPAVPAAERQRAVSVEVIALHDLLQFWRHPVRYHCLRVLRLRFADEDDREDDAEPFRLHGLDRYLLSERAVRARLGGGPDPVAAPAAALNGMLPPGSLGELVRVQLDVEVGRFLDRIRGRIGPRSARVEVRGADYVVRGELHGLGEEAQVLWRPARLKGKDRLRAWIQHVVRCAAADQGADLPRTTLVLATDGEAEAANSIDAAVHLDRLVQGWREGQHRPLPFFEHASHELVRPTPRPRTREAALVAARRHFLPQDWEEAGGGGHDLPDPCIELCFRDQDPVGTAEFAHWADTIFQPAVTVIAGEAGGEL